jgi:hypothetical protein
MQPRRRRTDGHKSHGNSDQNGQTSAGNGHGQASKRHGLNWGIRRLRQVTTAKAGPHRLQTPIPLDLTALGAPLN